MFARILEQDQPPREFEPMKDKDLTREQGNKVWLWIWSNDYGGFIWKPTINLLKIKPKQGVTHG